MITCSNQNIIHYFVPKEYTQKNIQEQVLIINEDELLVGITMWRWPKRLGELFVIKIKHLDRGSMLALFITHNSVMFYKPDCQ